MTSEISAPFMETVTSAWYNVIRGSQARCRGREFGDRVKDLRQKQVRS